MRTKIQIDDGFNCKFPIKRKAAKIVRLLLEKDDIVRNSALFGFEFETVSFDIVLTDNVEIQKINREYRKIDRPTDVITFALFADDENKFVFEGDINLGEIIISVEKAKEQAKESLEKEILTLICHGVLHLLGFDHQTDKDYNFVVKTQEDIISKL